MPDRPTLAAAWALIFANRTETKLQNKGKPGQGFSPPGKKKKRKKKKKKGRKGWWWCSGFERSRRCVVHGWCWFGLGRGWRELNLLPTSTHPAPCLFVLLQYFRCLKMGCPRVLHEGCRSFAHFARFKSLSFGQSWLWFWMRAGLMIDLAGLKIDLASTSS